MTPVSARYHHGNLREALVQAAVELVAETGVPGLSLRAVARKAGVSQAAPYHHFKDKEALLAEVAATGFATLVAMQQQAIDAHPSAIDGLRAMGRAYVGFATSHPACFRVMFGPWIDKSEHDDLQDCAVDSFGLLVEIVARGQQRGELRGTDPVPVAMATWSGVHGVASLLIDGIASQRKMAEHDVSAEQLVEHTLDMIMLGLLTEGARAEG